MNPTPLTPVTLEGDETISAADAPDFWTAVLAKIPLPAGKTVAQISGAAISVNPATKAVRVQVRFFN
jgi:hypothetical protein